MSGPTTFDQLLDAVDHLSPDEQAALVDVVRRRLAEQGRERVAAEIVQARSEHAAGQTSASSVDEIMREIES